MSFFTPKAAARFALMSVALSVALPAAETPALPVLKIDATQAVAKVSPIHAGLMTEEINHSYDGGLYGELLGNRAFQEDTPLGYSAPPFWTLAASVASQGSITLDRTHPLSPQLPVSLRIDCSALPMTVANSGYWGVPVRANTLYRVSFYARTDEAKPVRVTLALTSDETRRNFVTTDVAVSGSEWKRYEATFTTSPNQTPTARASFTISPQQTGRLWLALVSLFGPTYHDRTNGNRPDLMEKLAAMHPKFLRLPGGNYLEGNRLSERFDWKATLGDLTQRTGHHCPWGYRSSDGLGLLEFMHWCEDLEVEPVLGVFSGLTLDQKFVKPGKDLEPYVQDALDEVEYLTGTASTKWGARRGQDGHPAPFKLTYVEIGNEDWEENNEYDARFAQFYDAFKAKHPELQLIATKPVKSRVPDVLDDHYYRKAEEFFADVHHYDATDRKGPKIFVGEWATMEGAPTPNFHAALGDAAWMTAMERNSDLIVMQAYAPLLVNVNDYPKAWQWPTNLIGYDALRSFGSPAYYAQVMFNAHRGDEILGTPRDVGPDFFYSATRDSKSGTIYLKAVNAAAAPRAIRLELAGVGATAPQGQAHVLSAALDAVNSLDAPEKVMPVDSPVTGLAPTFEHTFPAHSITVLEIPVR